MTDEPLRIGVLGAARIAELSIVGPARTTGHRLVAVAARDRDRAEAFAATHGVERVADSYAELVADPEIEVVYNPLANSLHGPWNLAALQAGKHVLTEKPSASNTEEAAQVHEAVAKAGTVFMEGFHYLFHPVTRRLHELLDSGELGDLRHVETMVAMPAPPDDDVRWQLPLAGGAWQMSCRVVGSRGEATAVNFVQPHLDDRVVVRTAAGERTEELGRRSSYTYQLEAFAAHLRRGTPLTLDADDALTTMRLIDDSYRAAGFPVRPRTVLPAAA